MIPNGDEIRRRRILKGLSQDSLAKTCDLNVRTIRRAEQGRKLIAPTMKCIADALACNIEDIVHEIGDATEPRPGPEDALRSVNEGGPSLQQREYAVRLQAQQQVMDESVVLIPAAGDVPDGLFTHVTVHCPSLFPVGGKPTVHWQLSWLRDQGFRRFLIGVTSGKERLESVLQSSFPHLDVQVVLDQHGGGVGRTVKRLLEVALKEPNPAQHALVVLGDTIAEFLTPRDADQFKGHTPTSQVVGETRNLGPVDFNRNWVLYDHVSDTKRWCLFKREQATGRIMFEEKKDFALEEYGVEATFKALVGVYYFSDAHATLAIATHLDASVQLRDQPLEMSYILNALDDPHIHFYRARFWADVGHADRLILAHAALLERHGLRERDFNVVQVDVGRGTIRKSLSSCAQDTERSKFIDEIEAYARLPQTLQIHFPRVVSAQTNWESPRLMLEYYPYPNLSDLWVYGTLDPDVWSRIFEHLREILGEFAMFKRPTDQEALKEMYVKKSIVRITRLQDELLSTSNGDEYSAILRGLLDGDRYTFEGKSLPNLAEYIRNLPSDARSLLQKCPNFTIIHGDVGFPNILIQLPSGICKLVDPRGSFGRTNGVYGDPYYDVAKINHSLEGYDFIVNDLFETTVQGRDLGFRVFYPESHKGISDRFNGIFLGDSEGYFAMKRVRLITGLLFASMMPLHPVPKQQLAMYLTASRLLNNF